MHLPMPLFVERNGDWRVLHWTAWWWVFRALSKRLSVMERYVLCYTWECNFESIIRTYIITFLTLQAVWRQGRDIDKCVQVRDSVTSRSHYAWNWRLEWSSKLVSRVQEYMEQNFLLKNKSLDIFIHSHSDSYSGWLACFCAFAIRPEHDSLSQVYWIATSSSWFSRIQQTRLDGTNDSSSGCLSNCTVQLLEQFGIVCIVHLSHARCRVHDGVSCETRSKPLSYRKIGL